MPEDRDEQDIRINVLSRDKCFVGDREDSITNGVFPGIYIEPLLFVIPPPPPGFYLDFSKKKERKKWGEKIDRERKQLVTITRATAHEIKPSARVQSRTVTERSKNSPFEIPSR